jgi:predicted enzyme related to lactoylglutathione lyase
MFVKFTTLPVHDQERAVDFYTRRLGMTVAQDADYGGGWRWIELAMDGAQTHITLTKAESAEQPDQPALVLVEDDVAALHKRLIGAGVAIKQAPEVAAWNPEEMSAQFIDSEGNIILVTGPALP